MPAQTTLTNKVYFPDGAKVSVKAAGESTYTDIGAINSAINLTLNWTENQVLSANAGRLLKQIKDMIIDGSFTLIQLDADNLNRLSGDLFEKVATPGTSIDSADFDTQEVVDIVLGKMYDLEAIVTATGEPIKFSAAPVIASVMNGAVAMTAGEEYTVVANASSPSGYSIVFMGTLALSAGDDLEITFGNNVPVATTAIYCGSSTATLDAYALRFSHTDDTGAEDRVFELYSVDPTSGGFQFGFKGANEDGVEEMPISFQGKIDTTRADGRQLFGWVTR